MSHQFRAKQHRDNQSEHQLNADGGAERLKSALVLGAGGAARAACAALREMGVAEVAVANRTQAKAEALAGDFNAVAVPWEQRAGRGWDLLINTTPLGMQGERQDESPWPLEALGQVGLVFDLVYNPIRTKLLGAAKDAGVECISGLAMFLHQGLAQFELWTGRRLDERRAAQVLMADMALTGG